MPVPSLPLDLIIVIASHFETNPFREEESKVQEQVKAGKALSLVCRAWRPIGQGLRWRSLRISESRIPSLLEHISLCPRLAKLVRTFDFTQSRRNVTGGGYTQAQNIESLPLLLAVLANLRICMISGDVGEHLVAILRSLSTLEGLERLGLFGTCYANCSDEMEAIFSSGYQKLWYLAFCMENLSLSSQSDLTLRLGAPPKSLQGLNLGWTGPSTVYAERCCRLLSLLNPTTLRSAWLNGSAISPKILKSLLVFPSLTTLYLKASTDQLRNEMNNIVADLHQFSALKLLRIIPSGISGGASFDSPVPLLTILSSLPPSLVQFRAAQMVFSDYESVPPQDFSERGTSALPCLVARCPTTCQASGTVGLLVWAKEGGNEIRWYRRARQE